MEFVVHDSKSHKSIHVEEIGHGKFDRISSTSLLVNVGASGPALKAGRPETGSITIRARYERFFVGVRTIRPPSIFASSGSPGRRSSRRRIGPGRTTCPLVEILVFMVRRSYLNYARFSIAG